MNKKRRRRIWIWLLVVVVALIAATVLCNVLGNRSPAPEVTVRDLAPRKIISTVSGTGELRSANQVDISAETVARVDHLYVEEGDQVRKGQLLCVLDDAGKLSSRDLSRANFEEALASYQRGEALYADSLISTAEFERLRTTYEVARAQLNQSQDQLAKTRIYAPISGRVVALNIEEGETVMMGTMNNPGTVIMTIADLSAMQARIDVDESDVVSVEIGQRADVTLDAMPDTTFVAAVYSVSYMPNMSNLASTAEGITDFEVVLNLTETHSALRPGMSVTADIVTARREDVIVCPIQAIGRREMKGISTLDALGRSACFTLTIAVVRSICEILDKEIGFGMDVSPGEFRSNNEGKTRETVFILEDGKAKLVPIETGISDGRSTEITEGLEEGQTVITGPYKILRILEDGDEVKPKEEEQWQQRRANGPRVEVQVETR